MGFSDSVGFCRAMWCLVAVSGSYIGNWVKAFYGSVPGAKSLSGSSYYIPSLLSISTVDAIEALNAISGGEDIPVATIGVDGTSFVTVRAFGKCLPAPLPILRGSKN
ncbi:hypothetical protein RND71_009685 [Anisodus tanguticus]|uniref:Uncharacterized protein n=1 Tax=Anisodus tanguticus TaxID=243964 RepID=A0AAE1VS29_9SOLA|nr:hypothetical protein RND71_009685 [Anisodus tanguticus]